MADSARMGPDVLSDAATMLPSYKVRVQRQRMARYSHVCTAMQSHEQGTQEVVSVTKAFSNVQDPSLGHLHRKELGSFG